jgi:HD-GYP domain-containing protein (c-di-GMP phosphodiesterase class II)
VSKEFLPQIIPLFIDRKAWTWEQALQFLEEQKEKMLDPELVDIFKKLPENIENLYLPS